MSSCRPELVRSVDPQPQLDKLRADGVPDFAEYRLLQDCADDRLDQLLRKLEGRADLEPLRQAGIGMAHALQTTCLMLRRLELDAADQALARQALEYQLAYLHACLRRSMRSFDHSQ
ncbi:MULTISPECIES: hypothetical protein [unclassified Pseudomonas]|uniref:hypothetical protein n=1 Tax=unclassified Pseudomonas TaxID=196821 RepID=UPI00244C9046|nr:MULTISPECIES: hypothetical protein [unclassified Pseudomonas]MDH0302922.1 hypothetical protein [Pseudomonas sp. GD04091]MDH1985473.1 hypothetical protein [Pseudomonas sp. GD03689]